MSNISVEEKKVEAFNRMKSLGFFMEAREFDKTGKIRLFLQNTDLLLCVEGRELERVRAFELSYNALVFAAPEMYHLLYHILGVLPESESDLINRIAETLNVIDTNSSEERSFSCERVFNQDH